MSKREELELLIQNYKHMLEYHQAELDNLQEEKEPQLVWYTVFYVDWALHIDQRLDAQTEADARDMVKNTYVECDYDNLIVVEAEVSSKPQVIYNSYPF